VAAHPAPADLILEQLDDDLLGDAESLYKDVHSHPELSMQEQRTAGVAAERLRAAGFEITEQVGGTGVVGVLRSGDGPTVMLRADMDALPVQEQTGLDYASTTDGVMHACGHDMHVAWLAAASALLARGTEHWHGTLIALFQPGEETAEGARAMIDDGLFDRFPKPDVILGQHVMPSSAGVIGSRAGVITSAADSLQIRLFGRGAHGSMPQASIDPVVMAAATVLRLQTIVARELAPTDAAVLTVGALQAGTKENVIPDEAIIKLNVRTFDESTREHVLAAITRIVNAESEASGAPRPPEITPLDRYDLVTNDAAAVARLREAFTARFGAERVVQTGPISASEDFGSYGTGWHAPSVFWTVGGTDPDAYRRAEQAGTLNELPTNHNPHFAPVIHPTLETGVQTLVAGACAWLGYQSAGA
jgi:amidohydrolase